MDQCLFDWSGTGYLDQVGCLKPFRPGRRPILCLQHQLKEVSLCIEKFGDFYISGCMGVMGWNLSCQTPKLYGEPFLRYEQKTQRPPLQDISLIIDGH